MTLASRAAGTATSATAAVTAVNPAVPSGAVEGDLSVLTVWVKPYDTTLTTPSGWTKIGEATNGTTATGTDVGSTKVAVYVLEDAAVGAIGNIGQSGANTMGAVINVYSKTKSTWDYSQFTTGGDSTNGANYSATGAGGIAVATGDWVLQSTAMNSDLGTLSAFDIAGMSGATLGTDVNRTNAATTTGNDSRGVAGDVPITAGSSSAAPTYAFTNASSTSGTTLWLRLRETTVSNVVREKVTTGADNDAITAGNTGSDGVVVTGGTAVIDTDVWYSSPRSVLGDDTSTSGAVYWSSSIPSADVLASDIYIRINVAPAAEVGIIAFFTGSTRDISVGIIPNTGTSIIIRDGSSAGGANIYLSTQKLATGKWYRLSIFATQSATVGTVRAAFFDGADGTPLGDSTLLTGRHTGAAPYNTMRHGPKTNTGTQVANLNLDDWAYDRGPTDLIAAETFNVSATPTAIDTAEQFGTPVATVPLTATPSSITSAEAFGTPVATVPLTATPSSISSAEAFGTPEATIAAGNPTPDGIPSAEAFGTPTASSFLTATPSSIATAESFGTPVANVEITATPGSIGSAEAFGTPSAASVLTATPTGIPSQEAFGSPAAGGHLTSSPTGVVSSEGFGTPSAGGLLTATPSGIPSEEAIGTPQLVIAGISTPNSIPSAETFGTPAAVIPITATPGGVASLEAFGTPTADVEISATPSSIGTAEAFGTPAMSSLLVVTVDGIPTGETFGTPAVVVNMVYFVTAIGSAEAFGTPRAIMLIQFAVTGVRLQAFGAEPGNGEFKVSGASLTDWRADE